jgi:uncharacterized protein (TIGR02001 family)
VSALNYNQDFRLGLGRPVIWAIGFLVTLAIPTASALAQDSEFSLSGDVGAVSDYTFRGVSRSDGDPAVQAGIDLAHSSGFYLGAFLSSMDDLQDHHFEAEGYIGYGFSGGPWEYNLSLGIDSFHGNNDSDVFLELRGTISRDFGFAYVRSGLYFTPDNREIGLGRAVYAFGEGDFYIPAPGLPPITLNMKIGYEDFEGGLSKWDWSVGLFVEAGGLEWGLRYVDTNKRLVQGSRSRIVFGVKKYF